MTPIPADLLYIDTHEWVQVLEDGTAHIGITDHAQALLGDLVFIELPAIGEHMKAGQECGVLESVKAASDLYSPVAGVVIALNDGLIDAPERLNSDPYAAWLLQIQLDDSHALDSLMDADAYAALLANE
jgi:glycine cleavage system H protein